MACFPPDWELLLTLPQDFTKVVKNADIRTLTDSGVLLTSYYGLTHPSQPNYIASVAGDYFGLDSDGSVSVPENVSTLVDLFAPSGIQWREYMEDIPSPGFTGVSAGGSKSNLYVRKHKLSQSSE